MRGVVKGTGSYLPIRTVSNYDLSEVIETDDQWIQERTGIVNRHIITTETTTSMAIAAAREAVADSGIDSIEIDMILVATMSSDVIMPNTGCMVQEAIGARKAVCFDINSACSGFLFAYNTAQAYLASGVVHTVLVIGAESLSRLVDWKDRSTCILFGDGAGAVVLTSESGEENAWDLNLHLVMYASGERGGALTCDTLGPGEERGVAHYIQMQGQEIFRFAVRQVPNIIQELLEKMEKDLEDIDWIILHQANKRIVHAVAKRLNCPLEKFPMNLMECGNTSAASIPILLDELNRKGKLKKGNRIIMAGFGAGLTWGATYLEW